MSIHQDNFTKGGVMAYRDVVKCHIELSMVYAALCLAYGQCCVL